MRLILVCVLFAVATATDPTELDPTKFEGDMILTKAEIDAAIHGEDVDSASMKRKAVKNKEWPGGVVVYEISTRLAKEVNATKAIKDAMEEWSSKTCIRFRERTNEISYVYFGISRTGCSSNVGRQGRVQFIFLHSSCLHSGIVVHEIGHTLGLYHEQSRTDRDTYVTIKWDNIKDGVKNNFQKYGHSHIDSLGVPYDYESIMHYEATAFSKNGKETIVPKIPGVTIGQRKVLSRYDAKMINLLYAEQCPCVDEDHHCPGWAAYCGTSDYVKKNCRKTCKRCYRSDKCTDRDAECPDWVKHCGSDNLYLKTNCKLTCKLC